MKAKRELMELDEVLTPKEAAAALKVRVTTLSNWRVAGRGPQFTRVGRSVRYAKNDLAAYLAARTRHNTSEAVD